MSTNRKKIIMITFSVGFSLLFHVFFLYTLNMFGNYDFVAPVNQLQPIMVDLRKLGITAPPVVAPLVEKIKPFPHVARAAVTPPQPVMENIPKIPPDHIPPLPELNSEETAAIPEEKSATSVLEENALEHSPSVSQQITSAVEILPPLRTAGEFLASTSENLSYVISLMGVPVGNAELVAKNEQGEVRITLRVNSNTAMSNVYPVHNVIETRHIAGNFVITKIKQHEGDLKSDIGFTIFLREKSVFWIDRIRNRHSRETVPNSEVLDTLSAFYFLRNKELQVGKTETLHVYDSEKYVSVPIEVLRRENILLPNLTTIDTLVIHPVRKENGAFSKTRDMRIWLTDDDKKVPVKAEISTPLGRMTAELISAAGSEP